MTEYNPVQENAARAQAIRRKYMEKGTTKIDQLEALDSKVKTPALAVASIVGILGALVMGAGMSNIMVYENMTLGLALGVPGLIAVCMVWPLYKEILNRRKKKYASQIMELSGAILEEQEGLQ